VTADLPGKAVVSADYAHGDFEGHLSVRRPGEPASHAPHPSAWLTAETRQTLFGMLYSAAHLSSFAVPPPSSPPARAWHGSSPMSTGT
jgi:hypothetical protein